MAIQYPGIIPDLLTRFGINPLDFTSYTDLLRELQALFNAAGVNPQGTGGTIDGRFDAIELELAAPALSVITADSTAIANTATETAFSNGVYTVPANSATVGRTYRITAGGKVSTMAGSPGALSWTVRWGSVNTDPLLVNIGATVALNPSVVNRGWAFTALVTVRSIGASGSANGTAHGINLACAFPGIGEFTSSGVVTINTTVPKSMTLFGLWGVANAANTVTLEDFVVEQVN